VSATVAVAVVSWNTRDLLAECLRSLAPDAHAGRADVWVVDNGSSDGSQDMVRHEFGWTTLVEPEQNIGFGRAVNLVAERSSSPWVVAANADVTLLPGALGRLLAAGESDQRAGILAPRLILPDGSTQHSVFSFPTVALALVFGTGAWRLKAGLADRLCIEGAWNADRERSVPWAVGAFVLIRRAVFDAVGGFDARQWIYAEDLDLGWRVAGGGWTTHYVPRAHVGHAASAATTLAFGDTRRRRHMAASYVWMLRRRGRSVTAAFAVANLATLAARALWLAPVAALRPGRRPELADSAAWAAIHLRGLISPGAGDESAWSA
jgi:GT2 family glycosyltransferase